jgi:hypothetical protein
MYVFQIFLRATNKGDTACGVSQDAPVCMYFKFF